MALSLITSYFVQQNTTAATAITTPSFTPTNGEVIVVKLGTWATAMAMGAPTGGSQTYTSRVINAPGGFNSWCGIYTAVISGSPGAMTISSTPAGSARYSMTVERWSGAQLAATPVTNSTSGAGAVAASTITPAQGTSVISWCSGDAQSVDPATHAYLASGVDEGERDGHVGANGVEYYGYQFASGTGSQSYGLSAPTGQTFVIAGIEVQAAPTGTGVWLPTPRARVRTQPPRRQPRAFTPVRPQVNPPFPFAGIKQPRQPRGLLPRRAHLSTPVPAQIVIVPPAYPPLPVHTRARGRLARRPSATPIPGRQLPPLVVQRPRLKLPRLFRPRASTVPPQQIIVTPPAYPPAPVRTRLRGLRLFRPRIAVVLPPQIVVTPPAYPPAPVRTRLRGLRLFRPRAAAAPFDQPAAPAPGRSRPKLPRLFRPRISATPPAQIVVTPPSCPPAPVRTRLRGLRLFRPRAGSPVPAQAAAPVAPPFISPLVRVRLRFGRLFRARAATPIAPQPTPAPAPHLRPHNTPPRRGRSFGPVPPQIVVIPPAYPVKPSRPRLRGLRLWRGRTAMPVPPQEIQPTPPPVPPPTPVVRQGSWWSLVSVERENRAIAAQEQPKACPNDGEPLRLSADGYYFCRYDGFVLGDVPVNRRIQGQDWGGLGGVINSVTADTTEDIGRRTLSCPNDGEPFSRAADGTLFCRYDGWRPDGGTMPADPGL